MTAFATSGLVLTLGKVICGIGMAAARFRPSLGAISRQTPPEKRCRRRDRRWLDRAVRDRAVRIAAAASARQLAHQDVDPGGFIDGDGAARAGTARTARGRKPRHNHAAGLQSWAARGVRDAGVLAADGRLFVCGFHVTFIGLHLPAYIPDKAVGMSVIGRPASALELGGWAIGLVGLFNLAGSLFWGWLGSRYPKKDRRRPWPSRSKSMG